MTDPAHRPIPEAIEAACYERWFEHPAAQRAHARHDLCAEFPEWAAEITTLMGRLQEGAGLLELADVTSRSTDGQRVETGTTAPSPDIAGYEVLELLGSGGFGRVYRARQLAPVDREVAIKVLRVSAMGERAQARFAIERQALARMQHPSVAAVLDAGTTADDRPFFAMEFVAGATVRDYCDHERLTVADRIALIAKVGRGLEHAHQRGVIHRDLKPSNVLVVKGPDGPRPVVIDFGLAKAIDEEQEVDSDHTIEGSFVGTPFYASPEQAAGERADTRTDVYGLGLLLYELLTGDVPHGAARLKSTTVREALRIVSEEEPRSLARALRENRNANRIASTRNLSPAQLAKLLRGDVDNIVRCALSRDPSDRYGSAGAMVADLERYLDGLPITARSHTWHYLLGKFWRRHRIAVTAAAIFALTVAAGTVTVIWGATQLAEEQRRTAEQQARARRNEYAFGIRAAKLALDRGSPTDALEHLQGLPADQRNWEFDYLQTSAKPPGEIIDTGQPTDVISALAWLRDGRLVTGYEHYPRPIEFWDAETLEKLETWHASPGAVKRIWPVGSDQLCLLLTRHEDAELRLVSKDTNSILASAAGKCRSAVCHEHVRWAFASTERLVCGRFDRPGALIELPWQGRVNALEFGRESLELFLATDHGQILRFNPDDPADQPTDLLTRGAKRQYREEISHLGFVSSRDELLVARGRELSVRNARTGEVRFEHEFRQELRSIAIDSSTDLAFLGGGWGTALASSVDLTTGRVRGEWSGHRNGVFATAIEPDGDRFASAGVDGKVRIWNKQPPASSQIEVLGWDCRGMAFSPDESRIAFCDQKDSLEVLRLSDGTRTLQTLQPEGRARGEYLAFDGERIFVGSFDGCIRVYDAASGEIIRKRQAFGVDKRILDIEVSNDQSRIAATSYEDEELAMLDSVTLEDVWRIPQPVAHHIWFAPDGKHVLVSDWHSHLRKFAIADGRLMEEHQFRNPIHDLAWTPDGRHFVACIGNGEVLLTRADTLQPVRAFAPHSLKCFAAAVSPDGTRLATGGPDDPVRILDFATGTKLLELNHPCGNMSDLRWSSDGRSLIGRAFNWRSPTYLVRWEAGLKRR